MRKAASTRGGTTGCCPSPRTTDCASTSSCRRSRWPDAARKARSTATSARASSPPITRRCWPPSRTTDTALRTTDSLTATPEADLVVVGGGAAGLMAALWAARSAPDLRVLLVDGARVLGAKILVSGGGRCNVTHHVVDERDFNGSAP